MNSLAIGAWQWGDKSFWGYDTYGGYGEDEIRSETHICSCCSVHHVCRLLHSCLCIYTQISSVVTHLPFMQKSLPRHCRFWTQLRGHSRSVCCHNLNTACKYATCCKLFTTTMHPAIPCSDDHDTLHRLSECDCQAES